MWRMDAVSNIHWCWSMNPTQKSTERQYLPLPHSFRIGPIILWNAWLVQWWWRIVNAGKCGWNDTWTMRLRIRLTDRRQALFEFTAWITKELGANWSESQWLPLRNDGDWQYILDTGHHRLVAPRSGNTLTVRRSPKCCTRPILYHTKLCRSGGQFFPWAGWYWLESVRNPRWDPSNKSRCIAVFWSP